MKKFAWALSCVAVTACGGGSGGGSGGVPVVTGAATTPTPAPTPSSGPSPAPSPSPSSPPTYATAFDFASDRSFLAFGSELRSLSRPGAPAELNLRLLASDNQATFAYADATQSLNINFDRDAWAYAGGDNHSRSDQHLYWYSQPRQSSVRIVRPAPAYAYVLLARQDIERRTANGATEKVDRLAVFGVPTLAADLPTTGTVSYPVVLTSTPPTPQDIGGFYATGSLRIDYATGRVTGDLAAVESTTNGRTPLRATLTFSGAVAPATGLMKGTIDSADGGFSGNFDGRAFGPRAVEAGAAFTLTRADGTRVAGAVVGRR